MQDTIKQLLTAESTIGCTTLVTIYVAANSNLWLPADLVADELKTASNIKNKQVGKAVTAALKMIQHKLKMLKVTPVGGVVLCAGDYRIRTVTGNKKESYV